MATTAMSVLTQRLSEGVGDWIEELVTTLLAKNTSIISTHLLKWDDAQDGAFNGWWAYITNVNNIDAERLVYDYSTTAQTLSIRGGNLSSTDATMATFRLGRYSQAEKERAVNDAIREIFPNLYRHLDLQTLVAGNILPNSHFEDWAVTTIPDLYTAPTGSVAAATAVAYIRGGAKSAFVTAGATPDYFYITSNDYPRLLDLMDKTITFKCWAYPVDTADDASIQIYTIKADGTTTQTLSSTTSTPKGAWTLIELEDQEINDDIVEIQFRFVVKTDTKKAYFDAARVTGRSIYEYLIPTSFRDGHISQVFIQTSGYSDDPCDDLQPQAWEPLFGWQIIDNGTYGYLRLPYLYGSPYKIRLYGYAPLEVLSTYAGTISLSGERVNLLVAYAKYKLYQNHEDPAASEDVGRYERASGKAYGEYLRLLPRLRMSRPSEFPNLPVW